jgi:uncharacterized membrane protein (DUF106 family)
MKKDIWLFLIVLFVSMFIASLWETTINFADRVFTIKEIVGDILNPSLGALIEMNQWFGFIIIVAITSLIFTLAQKYLSDQKALKEIKKEQKYLQDEMKKYKDHPEKLLEFQKKQLEFFPRTFELTMKPLIYTSIPMILLFRWFSDVFNPIFGGWWFLWYIIASMIISSILRKVLDVA